MPVEQFPGLVDIGWGETVWIGIVVGQLGVEVVVDIPLLKNYGQTMGQGATVTYGKLTIFSKVVGRPKVKSLSLLKKCEPRWPSS